MRFLFDNNFSPRLVNMLRVLGIDGVALRDEFPPDIADVDLFPRLQGTDWIFVTADTRIKRRTAEARALRECGVSAIFLKRFWMQRGFWQQAEWLTRNWPKLEHFVKTAHQPIYAEVDSQGKITEFKI
jgi:hypothetical protein